MSGLVGGSCSERVERRVLSCARLRTL